MDLTDSHQRFFGEDIRRRYDFVEIRDAAGFLAAANPAEHADIVQALGAFKLTCQHLTTPGGNKGLVAVELDETFRRLGWREAKHEIEIISTLTIRPYRAAHESVPRVRSTRTRAPGHLVDNVKARVALDVEWNAKDGNLDRDLSNFRALHDAGVINLGVMITRTHVRTKYAANYLAQAAGLIPRRNTKGQPVVLFSTTTTTNLERLRWRLQRGDAGGCPVLGVGITDRCYVPGPGDPRLPEHDVPELLAAAEAGLEDDTSID